MNINEINKIFDEMTNNINYIWKKINKKNS